MRLRVLFIAATLFAGSVAATAQGAAPTQSPQPSQPGATDQQQPAADNKPDSQVSAQQQFEAAEAQHANCDEAANRVAKLEAENRELKGRLERLSRQVTELNSLVPTPARDLTPLQSFATDTTVTIAFKADGGTAWVRAQAREVGGGPVGSPVLSEAMSTTPRVKLTGLDPGKAYRIDAVALRSPNGPEISGTRLLGEDWPQLQVSAKRDENKPVITLLRETSSETSHELVLNVSPRSLLKVECFQVVDPNDLNNLGPEVTCAKPPAIEEDSLTGEIRSTSWEAGSVTRRLTGLQPGTDYVVRITARNKYGQLAEQEFRRRFMTRKSNPFRLAQPLEFTFSPAGLEVKATASRPLRFAQLQLAYPGRHYTNNDTLQQTELNGSTSATFQFPDLQGPKVEPKGEKKGKEVTVGQALPPQLKLILQSDSGDLIEQDFIIGFIVPRSKEQVEQLQVRFGGRPLGDEQKKAIDAVLQTLAQPQSRKLTTEQWFQLGIPLLLAFL